MSISIHRKPAAVVHHPSPKPVTISLGDLKKAYDHGLEKAGYRPIADPEKDKSLKGTKALQTYKDTLGEGKNLDLCTDGDHEVYRGKHGELLVLTSPEDSSRGDDVFLFDKSGNKQLAHGLGHDGKLKWDAK